MQLQHLTTIPSIPVHKIYQHLRNSTIPVMPFDTESTGNTDSLWTLFTHLGIYISAIGSLIPVEELAYFVVTFGVNLPDQCADLYNQVTCNIQLWMIM